MNLKRIYIFILIGLLLSACKFGGDSKPLERSDSTAVHITRYDKLLTEYVKFNSFSALQKMNTESMQETKILIEDVLSIGGLTTITFIRSSKNSTQIPLCCNSWLMWKPNMKILGK
jgi:hypothetical protein